MIEKFIGKYSFQSFPSVAMENHDLAIAKDVKGMFYLMSLSDRVPKYPDGFDEIIEDVTHEGLETPQNSHAFFVRKGKYWGKLFYINP